MRREHTPEQRARADGLFYGKFGYEVTRCPYAPGDYSPEARGWRQGWTLGNARFQAAMRLYEETQA